MKIKKTSWGRLSNEYHNIFYVNDSISSNKALHDFSPAAIYGNGRSYGDVCLNPNGNLIETKGLNKFLKFNNKTGVLTCESGLLLKEINNIFVPKGWMLPVTPGTQLGTVGGAIANDIHGKNHHRYGSFGNHIKNVRLLRTKEGIINCNIDNNKDLFFATIGGLGLTGLILTAEIQLRKVPGPFVKIENIAYENLDEFFKISSESEEDWEHVVSWLDCTSSKLGRGILTRGNFINNNKAKYSKKIEITFPFQPPISLVNKTSLNVFNKTYFRLMKILSGSSIQHYEKFLYPLDNILDWNKMYGPKGFYQYQSVIPKEHSVDATKEMLNKIKLSGEGSFLAVLKTFSNIKSLGMLSFPMEGVTLALDFPNKGKKTMKLFNELDQIVKESSGRIYMAKDATMSKDLFESGYENFENFVQYIDPGISSSMSRRLFKR